MLATSMALLIVSRGERACPDGIPTYDLPSYRLITDYQHGFHGFHGLETFPAAPFFWQNGGGVRML